MKGRPNLVRGIAMLSTLLLAGLLSAFSYSSISHSNPVFTPDLVCVDDTNLGMLRKQAQVMNGSLGTTTNTLSFVDHSCFESYITVDPGEHELETLNFTVSAQGWYTFLLAADFGAQFSIYQGEFFQPNPCSNFFGAANANASFPMPEDRLVPSNALSFYLSSDVTYSVVISNLSVGDFGNWELLTFSEFGEVINEFASPEIQELRYELLCADIDAMLFENDHSWIVNTDGSLDTVATRDEYFGGDQTALDDFLKKLHFAGMPTATGDCGPLVVTQSDEFSMSGDCGNMMITRSFAVRPTVNSGCPVTIDECEQLITLRRATLDDAGRAPYTVNIPCDTPFPPDGPTGGPDENPIPDFSGQPYMNTLSGIYPLDNLDLPCVVAASYSDEPHIDICEGSYRFRREWNLIDWCNPSDIRSYDEFISINDDMGPVFTGPNDPIIASLSAFGCFNVFEVPLPEVAPGNGCSEVIYGAYEIRYASGALVTIGMLGDKIAYLLVLGEYDLTRCLEDECGNETCLTTRVVVIDGVQPTSICQDSITVVLGPGDIANNVEGITRVYPEDIDDGSIDNCGPVELLIRRNYWEQWTCDPNPDSWSPWGEFFDVFCCDRGNTISAQLLVIEENDLQDTCLTVITIEDQFAPFCYAPENESFSCDAPLEDYPGDIEEAYSANFSATSQLMNSLFGGASGTDNCAIDTIVERTPLIQLNDCGIGTITRYFEAWQALPDADFSDGLQEDEVNRSTNNCSQIITIRHTADFEISFPADAMVDCAMLESSEVEITANGCDVFGVNTDFTAAYPPVGEECYQVAITYDVINWCQWDGQYEGFEVLRLTEEDGDSLATGYSVEPAERPILRLTSAISSNDENCDGEFDPSDVRYYLTLDRSHPDVDGDSMLPDEQYDNDTATPTDCLPADANGLRNYGRYRYTQLVRIFNVTDLILEVEDFGGPTASCPDLLPGQFGTDNPDCEKEVNIVLRPRSSCELANGSGLAAATVISAQFSAFAVDTDGDGQVGATEFTGEEDVIDQIVPNEDGTFSFVGTFPIITSAQGDNIYHAFWVNFEDACGNQTAEFVTFDIVDCYGPAPICINGITVTLVPQPDGTCSNTIHARDFEGSPISDCTGQGPDLFFGRPVVTQYAIYYAEDVETNPNFVPNPADSLLTFREESEELEVLYIYTFDEEGNYAFCETYALVQFDVMCSEVGVIPFCFAPDPASFSCGNAPGGLPDDFEEAYSTDFGATSTLMNTLFGTPTGTVVTDTVVELSPLIQLNECGTGTITRFFQAWQALPDADRTDGLQIDEVIASSNDCPQIIDVQPGTEFEIAFPADAEIDCSSSIPTDIEITTNGCDVIAVNTSIADSYPPTGEECFQLAVVYDVINWCQWDGLYEGYEVPRMTEEDGVLLATGYSVEEAEHPILRMTSAVGPDDEDCDGELSPSENGMDDANDLRYFLTIDRNHPDVNGDSSLPDEQFDNVADTTPDCLPADTNGASNYGRYRYTQILQVVNATDLEVVTLDFGGPTDLCPDLQAGQFGDAEGNCETDVQISFIPASSCDLLTNIGSELTYTSLLSASLDAFAVDVNGDGEIDAGEFVADEDVMDLIQDNGDGTFTFSGSFPISTVTDDNIVHALFISFADNCGNQNGAYIEFEVVDCAAPAPICFNELIVDLELQPDGSCAATVQATDFIASPIYDCTGQGVANAEGLLEVTSYAIYFAADVEGDPNFSPSSSDSILVVSENEPVFVYVFAFDEEGNYNFCETLLQPNPDPNCFGTIAGIITTRDDEAVAEVEVNINNEYLLLTEVDGAYSQGGLDRQSVYGISPFLNTDHSNGVKTIDLIILAKHLNGIELMEDPYQLIAADVDNSGDITAADFELLRQLILGNIDAFPNNTSWRFVVADYVFPVPTNPWLQSWPETITLTNLLEDVLDANFVGVKIGDLDDSAESNFQSPEYERALAGQLNLETADMALKAGEIYTISIEANFEDVLALQGTMQLNGVELLELQHGLTEVDDFGQRFIDQGYLTFSWGCGRDASRCVSTIDNPLFSLKIRAQHDVPLSDALSINSRYTPAEAYIVPTGQRQPHVFELGINFLKRQRSAEATLLDNVQLYQNIPNPFFGETTIRFYLPQTTPATLTITDLSGKAVAQISGSYSPGHHAMVVTDEMLNGASGVFYYSLQVGGDLLTRKMVILAK
ncbi:MAG: T9SS type A sorting domain-containing protein [Bacteroidota bacterium]